MHSVKTIEIIVCKLPASLWAVFTTNTSETDNKMDYFEYKEHQLLNVVQN